MIRFLSNAYLLLFIGFLIFTSCNRVPNNPWQNSIPSEAVLVHIAEERTTLSEITNQPLISFLESIGLTNLRDILEIEAASQNSIRLKGTFLLPIDANNMTTVWVADGTSEMISSIARFFERPFMENEYRFEGVNVHILRLNRTDEIAYLALAGSTMLFSLNSFALESALRAYLGNSKSFTFENPPVAGSLHYNNSMSDFWVKSLVAVRFRPLLEESISDIGSTVLNIEETGSTDGRRSFRIQGKIPTTGDSPFLKNTAVENFRPSLDRFIPADAAILAIFRDEYDTDLNNAEPRTPLDSVLYNQPNLIDLFRTYLLPETAMAGYHTLGFSPLEETIFLRRVSNPTLIRTELDRLADRGLINRLNQNYLIRSPYMAKLLGSSFYNYSDFYLGFVEDVLVLTPRNGLIQRVNNDYSRRRVMHFDETYTAAKNQHTTSVSAFLYADSRRLAPFLLPYIDQVSNAENLIGLFDILSFSIEAGTNNASWQLSTHATRRVQQPFADRWFFPLDGHDLVGPVTVANLTGGARDELLFATTGNRVFALASDGTEIFRVSTGNDVPIGSPIVFDWYQNNQQAVLIGAGNKVYAWNNRGELLPNFPFLLNERLSAPITVADINRSGFAEIVAPTIDRSLHVIDRRGLNIEGWPQSTNSTIRSQVLVSTFDNETLLLASAENALFGWRRDGRLHDGFPVFAEAPLTGSPQISGNNLLSGAADGNLYVFSRNPLFNQQVAPFQGQGNLLGVQRLNVGANTLWLADVRTMRVNLVENQTFNDEAIISYSTDGAVFIHDMAGNLIFSENMGQSMANRHTLLISDLNRDNFLELVTVSEFGNMYAWSIRTRERYTGIPSTAVHYPTATRIRGDASTYIIAGTREGLRAWAITN